MSIRLKARPEILDSRHDIVERLFSSIEQWMNHAASDEGRQQFLGRTVTHEQVFSRKIAAAVLSLSIWSSKGIPKAGPSKRNRSAAPTNLKSLRRQSLGVVVATPTLLGRQ
jgi:hypothetical protein